MFLKSKYVLSGLVAAIMLCCVSSTVVASPNWSIEGEYFEGCTCNPGCPCLFGSVPTHNMTCKISGVFNIKTGKYGDQDLAGQTVIGITDLTASADTNWMVFYLNSDTVSDAQKDALLDIFQNHVFGFAKVPQERVTVRTLPIHIESSTWRKKAVAGRSLTLDIEILHGSGAPDKPTQIVNKKFAIWAKEFDMTLDMGKAVTHQFIESSHEWDYDGRSGFSTTFKFTSN